MQAFAGPTHRVWGFDSFEGMPELTAEDADDGRPWVGVRAAKDTAVVAETFELLGIPMRGVELRVGWFEETLPTAVAAMGPIAVLRVDCDWYRATRYCLETLHGCVRAGGAVIIDDYSRFTGCRRAVDEFRDRHGVSAPLHRTDEQNEAYWIVGEG